MPNAASPQTSVTYTATSDTDSQPTTPSERAAHPRWRLSKQTSTPSSLVRLSHQVSNESALSASGVSAARRSPISADSAADSAPDSKSSPLAAHRDATSATADALLDPSMGTGRSPGSGVALRRAASQLSSADRAPHTAHQVSAPGAKADAELPCRHLERQWVLDSPYGSPSSSRANSTRLSDASSDASAAPAAIQLVQSGNAHLSVVREDQKAPAVVPATTHLSMHGCRYLAEHASLLSVPDRLVVLDLSRCALTALPPSLHECAALEELNLSQNPLQTLPRCASAAQLASLSHLRILLMDACQLETVPIELACVRELRVLALRHNRLTHLPGWMFLLDQLECLMLEGNDRIEEPWASVLGPLLSGQCLRRVGQPAADAGSTLPSDPDAAQSPTGGAPAAAAAASTLAGLRGRLQKTLRRRSLAPVSPTVEADDAPGRRAPHLPMSPVPDARAERADKVLVCFLPLLGEQGADAEASSYRYMSDVAAHVRHVLFYLRDLEELLPERHREEALGPVIRVGRPPAMLPQLSLPDGSGGGGRGTRSAPVSPVPSDAAGSDSGVPGLRAPYEPKEDARKRRGVLIEIVETERTYVAGLCEIIDIYIRRARKPLDGSSTGERVLPVGSERAVFGHMEGIVHFHRHVFLPALEQATASMIEALHAEVDEQLAQRSAESAVAVATAFCEHSAFFKMYMNYINQSETALRRVACWSGGETRGRGAALAAIRTLGRLRGAETSAEPAGDEEWLALSSAQRKAIRTYMRQCREDPRHSQLSLEAYLLLPIQRIPRYRLLLEQLVRCTDVGRFAARDAGVLQHALEHVSLVASWVNEGKRQSEQGQRLLAWQTRLRGSFTAPLVQPHRRLLCDGPMDLRRVVHRVPRRPQSFTSLDVLEQTNHQCPVQLLLCNDIAVVVSAVGPDGEYVSPSALPLNAAGAPESEAANADPNQYELTAVIKPCSYQPPRRLSAIIPPLPPACVLGRRHLRVVDSKYVFYFTLGSEGEAYRWRDALNSLTL